MDAQSKAAGELQDSKWSTWRDCLRLSEFASAIHLVHILRMMLFCSECRSQVASESLGAIQSQVTYPLTAHTCQDRLTESADAMISL
jgi:hypothetical protein